MLVIREHWAKLVNAVLEAVKIDARIDHRSHKDRGIDMPPQIHVGVNATNAARRGEELASFPLLSKSNKIINYPKIDHGQKRAERNAEIINLQKYRHSETTAEQLARLNAQLVDVSANIDTLRAQLDNKYLSDDLRAKIRIAIEKAVLKIILKGQHETAYLKKVREARAAARKLRELEVYYQRLIDIQKETEKKLEQEKKALEERKRLTAFIDAMSIKLNGVPPYIIKLDIPLSSAFNEASYVSALKQQSTPDLIKSVLSPPILPTKPAMATVTLRQDVLQVKELLSRNRPKSGSAGRKTMAQVFGVKGNRR